MRYLFIAFIFSSFLNHAQARQSKFISTRGPVAAPTGAKKLCQRYQWACDHSGMADPKNPLSLKQIRSLNRKINRKYREISDQQQYGQKEYWAPLTKRGGDCEDFALTKKYNLIHYGVPPESLVISTVLDKRRNAHAVLILLTRQGDYVLDNLTNQMKLWNRTGYFYLRMQNPEAPHLWENVFLKGK